MQLQHGRSPTTKELEQIRGRFLELIQQAQKQKPSAFSPLPGLESWLQGLLESEQNLIAVATGGWGHTARFKLQAAGLEKFGLPLSSCDGAVSRVDIMQDAFKQLSNQLQNEYDFEAIQTIYVGDGLWDYRASQDLGWAFIGIAEGSRAEILHKAGAQHVFCNFDELPASNGLLNRIWPSTQELHA
jgi:phosphoglycolate phosphatase-like HAD superfamily hydrolase